MTNAHDISMLTQRITIIAGEDAVEVEHHQYTYLPAFAYIRDNAPALRVMFTLDETLDSWNYPELTLPVEPDSPLNFTIKAGYQPGNPGGSEVAQFAILLLQDYRQIPISPETDVFYGEVDSETAYAEIPVTLTTPLKTGKHDLIAIRIYSPAYALCDVLAVPERQIIEVWAERVAIEVVEAPQ